jgi:protoporphyrinogen oxidase
VVSSPSPHVVIVGSGISGLAAANEVQRGGLSALVLEAAQEVGGRVRTEHWDGARIELGAHVITPAYSRTLELVDELDLREDLVPVEQAFLTSVRRGSEWHYVDYADPGSLRGFSALSWRDKVSLVRGGAPAVIRSRRLRYGDITTAAALDDMRASDAFRADVLRYYIAPLYEAFFGYREEDLSYAVLALAMLSRGRPLTFASGMGVLTDALASRVEVRTATPVVRVRPRNGGVEIAFRDANRDQHEIRAQAAILATPAAQTAKLWPDAAEPVKRILATAPSSRADRAYLRTRSPYAPVSPDGRRLHMQLIPLEERQDRLMVLLEFMHQRAEDGGLLYAEAAPGSGAERLDERTLSERLHDEVVRMHPELQGEITGVRVVRTEPMTPIFSVGRSRELASFRQAAPPGAIELAGDYLNAPWIEGAVLSGERAAARVVDYVADPG